MQAQKQLGNHPGSRAIRLPAAGMARFCTNYRAWAALQLDVAPGWLAGWLAG